MKRSVFATRLADEYFRTVRETIKKLSHHQLCLGCRFAWVNTSEPRLTGFQNRQDGDKREQPRQLLQIPQSTGTSVEAFSTTNEHYFLEEAAPEHPQRSSNDGYFDPRNDQITRRHRDGANFAFCDGHVNYSRQTVIPYPFPEGDPRFEP